MASVTIGFFPGFANSEIDVKNTLNTYFAGNLLKNTALNCTLTGGTKTLLDAGFITDVSSSGMGGGFPNFYGFTGVATVNVSSTNCRYMLLLFGAVTGSLQTTTINVITKNNSSGIFSDANITKKVVLPPTGWAATYASGTYTLTYTPKTSGLLPTSVPYLYVDTGSSSNYIVSIKTTGSATLPLQLVTAGPQPIPLPDYDVPVIPYVPPAPIVAPLPVPVLPKKKGLSKGAIAGIVVAVIVGVSVAVLVPLYLKYKK